MWKRLFHVGRPVEKSFEDVMKFMRKTSIGRSDTLKEQTEWLKQKEALAKKFKGERWNPPKKLNRVQMESVRLLKRQFPDMSAKELSQQFKVSPEAIRRILKSRWKPNEREAERIEQRRSAKRAADKRLQPHSNNEQTGVSEIEVPKVVIYERPVIHPKGYFSKKNKHNGNDKPAALRSRNRRKLDLLKHSDD